MLHHFQKSWTPGFIQTSSRTSFGNSKEFCVFSRKSRYRANTIEGDFFLKQSAFGSMKNRSYVVIDNNSQRH